MLHGIQGLVDRKTIGHFLQPVDSLIDLIRQIIGGVRGVEVNGNIHHHVFQLTLRCREIWLLMLPVKP